MSPRLQINLARKQVNRGVTIVISTLMAEPSLFTSLTNRFRSRGVTVMFRGSPDRRMRFSSYKYSTIRASFRSVIEARMKHKGWGNGAWWCNHQVCGRTREVITR